MSLSILEFGSIIITVLIAIGIGVALMRMHARHWRSQQQDVQRLFEQLDLVRTDLIMLSEQFTSAAPSAGACHVQVATPLSEPGRTPQINASAPRAYEMAARLARGGASCEELMHACGLSRHEATLLLRLNAQPSAGKPAAKLTGRDQSRPRLSVAG